MSVGVVTWSTERGTALTVVVTGTYDTVVKLQRRRRRSLVGGARPDRTCVEQVLRRVPPDQSPRTAYKKHQQHRSFMPSVLFDAASWAAGTASGL